MSNNAGVLQLFCSSGDFTFHERLEVPFLLAQSKSAFKTSQRLRLLIVITWSVSGLKLLFLLLNARNSAAFARLLTLLLSITIVIGNAAYVTWRMNSHNWKRIHDERIKLWTWHVTAIIGCLVGSVLFQKGENDLATPLGNSILLSMTLIFDQIRLHISARLIALQLISLLLMECGRWYTMAGEGVRVIVHHIIRDTVAFLVLGALAPIMYLSGMEARARLKFLRQHGLPLELLQPFWRKVLRLQGYNLQEF